jgi:penicillin-binding protein 2
MMPEKVDNVQDTLDALKSVVDLNDDDIAAFKKSAPARTASPPFR